MLGNAELTVEMLIQLQKRTTKAERDDPAHKSSIHPRLSAIENLVLEEQEELIWLSTAFHLF